MPQIATITVTKDDGTTTFDLSPISGQQGKTEPGLLRNQAAGSYEQGESFSAMVRSSSAQNQRVTLRYRKPIIRSIDGVDTVTRIATANIEVTVPVEMSTAERKDLHAEIASIFSNSNVAKTIDELSPLY